MALFALSQALPNSPAIKDPDLIKLEYHINGQTLSQETGWVLRQLKAQS